jgi:hypothetical protein
LGRLEKIDAKEDFYISGEHGTALVDIQARKKIETAANK